MQRVKIASAWYGRPRRPAPREDEHRKEPGRHRDDLQGLRAVAVLLVAGSHAGVGLLRGGYIGVDVFFVLSGFLITGLLLTHAARHRYVSFREFYIRRAKRILPAATLTLVVTELAAWHFLNFVRAKQIVLDSVWASAFAANIHFAHQGSNYFATGQPPSPVQHFWSLAVEEQFYLVWPALLSLVLFGALRRRSRSRGGGRGVSRASTLRLLVLVTIAGAVSLAWSIHYTSSRPAASYFSTLTRAWELAIGAALAVAVSKPLTGLSRPPRIARTWGGAQVALGWAGMVAIGVAAVDYSGKTAFPGSAALLPTIGAALVIAAGIGEPNSRGVGQLLSLGPLRYIGDRSYAFYLWHWPVLIITELYVGHSLSLVQNILLILAAFVLSIVSYRFVENPIHRARWSTGPSAALWPWSFATVLLIAAVSLASLNTYSSQAELASAAPPTEFGAAEPVSSSSTGGSAATTSASDSILPAVIAAVTAAKRGASIPAALDPPVGQLLDSNYSGPSACSAHDGETSSAVCKMARTASRRALVVFGDSHAAMWMPAILDMAQLDGYDVRMLSKSACTPKGWVGSSNSECGKWYSWAVREAKDLHPAVVVIAGCCGGFTGTDGQTAQTAFIKTSAALKSSAARVIVIGDDVGIASQPVDCLLGRSASMKRCTTTWPADHFYLNQDLKTVSKSRGFGFIDTTGWFCFQNTCPTVVGHTIVYTDTGHITSQYAQVLAPYFRSAFRRALVR